MDNYAYEVEGQLLLQGKACCRNVEQHRPERFKRPRSWIGPIILVVVLVVQVALIYGLIIAVKAYLNMKMSPHDNTTRRVVCYYRWRVNSLEPKALPAGSLCTHIVLSFATVGNDFRVNLTTLGGSQAIETFVSQVRRVAMELSATAEDDADSSFAETRRKLAVGNVQPLSPSVRVMLSLGGGSGQANFAEMSSNPRHLETFLVSCKEVLTAADLDGLDFDWEFPGWFNRRDFGLLLQRTSLMLKDIGPKRAADPLQLSVALPGPFILALGFHVESIKRYCNFVNLMAYDLVLLNPLLRHTALHSSLHSQPYILYAPFSVEFALALWLMLGIPRTMLNLGIPTYGVAYALADKRQTGLFAPVKGYSRFGANVNYALICSITGVTGKAIRSDNISGSPFTDDANGTWISYDDPQSITEKVEFAKSEGLGGLMVFSLNADDHSGRCGHGRFPLTTAAVQSWRRSLEPSTEITETNAETATSSKRSIEDAHRLRLRR